MIRPEDFPKKLSIRKSNLLEYGGSVKSYWEIWDRKEANWLNPGKYNQKRRQKAITKRKKRKALKWLSTE